MHRATPAHSSFRSYVSGGSRVTITEVDDSKLMQEGSGDFMAQESRTGIEAPQNYGFTSVVMDATKDAQGNVTECAEAFVQFMGGNRSFPVMGPTDDRRHRMHKLEKGDVAMFRTKDDKQQLHLTASGGFWSAPQDKTIRMQLLSSSSGSASSASVEQHDSTSGSNGSSASSGQSQHGQEAVYKDGQNSGMFVDVTKDVTRMSGKEVFAMLDDGKTYVHVTKEKEVYLGGQKGKGSFALVMTESGPSANVYAKIGD